MNNQPDIFTVEILRQALASIAEEMSLVVMRAARSPLLREAGDHSSALTFLDGGVIAQGRDLPIHMGTMGFTVKEFLKYIDVKELAPGDIWYLNLPEVGGNHLPDVKAIRPIFHGGELLAFAVSLAHWEDIGGASPGSYTAHATDVWQDGLRIPPTRFFVDDEPVTQTLNLLLANVRTPDIIRGDMFAQAAATRVADGRLQALLDSHGAQTFKDAVAALNNITEAQTREAIRALPNGVYAGEDRMDDIGPNGERVTVRVTVTIEHDSAIFDFSATDDAIKAPINATPYLAATAAGFMIKALATQDIFHTDGFFRAVKVITRPGSLLQPPPHLPVVLGNHETSQRCADAIMKALVPCVPDALSAGGSASAAVLIFAGQWPDGRHWSFYETHSGGEGARLDRDGVASTKVNLANVMTTPAEMVEAQYPIAVHRQALLPGSGGQGGHSGGDGVVRAYEMLGDDTAFAAMLDRCEIAPYGLLGGADGRPYVLKRVTVDGNASIIPGRGHYRLMKGEKIIIETCGGGGYGKPASSQ
jgi:N-methylhydantoinase B